MKNYVIPVPKALFAGIIVMCILLARADAQELYEGSCHDCYGARYCVVNDFLIIATVRDYPSAQKIATESADKLGVSYRSHSAKPDSNGVLQYPDDTCKELGVYAASPCDVIRGLRGVNTEKKDNGIYITVEQSNSYVNLAPHFYMIVLGSGFPGDKSLLKWLPKAKRLYHDAYIRRVVLFADGCGE